MREVRRAYKALEDDEPAIKRVMALLEEADWVGPPDTSYQGSTRWAVNAEVHVRFAERAAVEAERREKARQEIAEAQQVI